MDPKISQDFPPFFRVYNDGRIHRYLPTDFVPPSPESGTVKSKDVIISPENNVAARIYLPSTNNQNQNRKFPLLIYIHGGAFSIQSAFSSIYHTFLTNLVSQSDVVAVSVDYRLAPENPLPACYDDAWSVFNWVLSHSRNTNEKEPWLSDYVDYKKIFLAGDSAGANIGHDIMVRASKDEEVVGDGCKVIEGMILIHPFFGGNKPDKLWEYICPETSGMNDPRLNPAADGDLLSRLACKRVMICTAEKDGLRKRGWYYYESLKRSEWKGEVEIVETEGEAHVFHLLDPDCENANIFIKQLASFINKIPLAAL